MINPTLGMVLLFMLVCIGIGLIAALIGISGGMLLIPALLFIFRFPMTDAIFMSLIGMMGLTVSAALSYMKNRYVNYHLAAVYSVLDYPGVILGGFIASFLFENVLAGLCGVIMILLGTKLFQTRDKHKATEIVEGKSDLENESCELEAAEKKESLHDEELKEESEIERSESNKEYKYEKLGVDNLKVVAFSSFSGGMIAGMLGLGGGTIETSSMLLAGVEPKTAAGTSELSMTFTAVFAAVFHLFLGNFNGVFIWPLLVSTGTVIGAQLGVGICKRIKGDQVQKIFSLIVLYAGFVMFLMVFDIGWV
ncbi:MAG: sulfite exporter TauE/SafE family protein [Promethearchaeia archaeon]